MLLNPEDGDGAAIISKRGLGDREGEEKLILNVKQRTV